MQNDNYCVYLHRHATDGIPFYVGSGVMGKRPNNFTGRSKEWELHKNTFGVTVEILKDKLSKNSARNLERDIIESNQYENLINTNSVVNEYSGFTLEDVVAYVEYDPSSPTKLIWKIKTGPRSKVGQTAGSFRFNKSLEKRGGSVRIYGKTREISRVVWVLNNGSIADDLVIDHYNGDSHDNSIENLRCVTIAENGRNRKRNKSSTNATVGVYETPTRYCASVRFGSISKHCSFSKAKYGEVEAYLKAVSWRSSILLEFNKNSANYSEKHFNEEDISIDHSHISSGYLGCKGLSLKRNKDGTIKCIIALTRLSDGKRKEKSFSVEKYTLDVAIMLAKEAIVNNLDNAA